MLIKVGDEPVHERFWWHEGSLYDLKIDDGNGSTNSKLASDPSGSGFSLLGSTLTLLE